MKLARGKEKRLILIGIYFSLVRRREETVEQALLSGDVSNISTNCGSFIELFLKAIKEV